MYVVFFIGGVRHETPDVFSMFLEFSVGKIGKRGLL